MPGIIGVFGADASKHIALARHRMRHRGSKESVDSLGPDGITVILNNGESASRSERDRWQMAAHLSDYSGPWRDRSGVVAANRLLGYLMAEDRQSLASWDGHFAFVAWDANTHHLVLGRDRLGAFPLFYAVGESGLIGVASEYKALLALPGVDPVPDLDMIQHLQFAKSLPPSRTLLQNVRAVQPGCIIRLGTDGNIVAETKIIPGEPRDLLSNLEDAKTRIFDALQAAVERRTGGADPIGIALSGGIDSIAIAAICRKLYPDREIRTFTAGYGPDDSDVTIAARVAKMIDSRHILVETPPDLMATGFGKLVWHLEDPIARSEALQLLFLGEEASKSVSTLLSAQGADGLFGGMPRHRLIRYMEWFPPAKQSLQQIYDYALSSRPPTRILARAAEAYLGRNTPAPPVIRGSSHIPEPSRWPESTRNLLNCMLSGWFKSNPKFERTFAASALDYTSPFYDPTLIELAMSVDSRLKITLSSQKHVLREAVRGLIPQELVSVPKMPQRMRYDSAFADALTTISAKILTPAAVESRGWFDPEQIAAMQNRKSGSAYSAEHAMRLWTAILTEEWARQFVDNKASLIDPT